MDLGRIPKKKILFLRQQLLSWADKIHRPMPWKGESDPYLIWLSEIILQQTRVEQGMPYYEKFKKKYPTVQKLANAPEDELMKLWEGLGYYSRARNLHAAAKHISQELGGHFPSTYENILSLKGVGPYTAAAIASFGFDLPYAVLDGNVFRILARFFGALIATDTSTGKKFFKHLAQEALAPGKAGRYNQAIMDFGALICTPQKPSCSTCPLKSSCSALAEGTISQLPLKTKKLERRSRYFHFLILNAGRKVFLQKRLDKDIWRNLYQFPLIETSASELNKEQILDLADKEGLLAAESTPKLISRSLPRKQTLTHQFIFATFWEFELSGPETVIAPDLIFTERKNLSKFAFPKVVDWYLGDNSLYLNLQ